MKIAFYLILLLLLILLTKLSIKGKIITETLVGGFFMWGDIAIAFLLAFITAYVITPYTIRFARKIGALDLPKEKRKIHESAMICIYQYLLCMDQWLLCRIQPGFPYDQ